MEEMTWSGEWGKTCNAVPIRDDDLIQTAKKSRNDMVDKLIEYDDELAEYILNNDCDSYDVIPSSVLIESCQRICLRHPGKTALVLLGSSYKNIGVQPLMNAIANYLPSPEKIQQPFLSKLKDQSKFCGMAFKIVAQQKSLKVNKNPKNQTLYQKRT